MSANGSSRVCSELCSTQPVTHRTCRDLHRRQSTPAPIGRARAEPGGPVARADTNAGMRTSSRTPGSNLHRRRERHKNRGAVAGAAPVWRFARHVTVALGAVGHADHAAGEMPLPVARIVADRRLILAAHSPATSLPVAAKGVPRLCRAVRHLEPRFKIGRLPGLSGASAWERTPARTGSATSLH